MIDLYAMVSPNVQKIYVMLEECDLPYVAHQVDIWKGDQFSPKLLKLNPNAKVPIIVDNDPGDSEPLVVFESGAILLYLAEKSGRLIPTNLRSRIDTLQWLMVQVANVGPMFGQFNHFSKFQSSNDYGLMRYKTQSEKLYRLVDDRLQRCEYLGGADFSIADVATYPWFRNQSQMFGESVPFTKRNNLSYPNLWRWFEQVDSRPAVRRAIETFEQFPSTLTTALEEEVDRVLGRGLFAYND